MRPTLSAAAVMMGSMEARSRTCAAFIGLLVALGLLASPAQGAPSEETIAAREYVLGAENVRADGSLPKNRVVVSWFGVASLAVAMDGRVVLLDTFINGLPPSTCGVDDSQPTDTSATGYVPLGYEQLVALDPKAIFIGHGHYDHECYTGVLAARTTSPVVGLTQHCETARAQAAAAGISAKIRCRTPLAADAPFGAKKKIRPVGRRVKVTVIRNLHSGAASAPPMDSDGAEAAMYRFRLRGFSFFWNNSAGPLREHAPAVLETMEGLPPTDVQFEATLGFGNPEQGFRDPADYAEALRVDELYSLHHDLFQNPVLSSALNDQMATELESRGLSSIFRPLQDPDDYLVPMTFRVRG